jgi:uncharacterized Zn finger protein
MLCPECNGAMDVEGEPFLKKVNGEKKFFITYICNECGYVLDEPVKFSKHDKRMKE